MSYEVPLAPGERPDDQITPGAPGQEDRGWPLWEVMQRTFVLHWLH